MLGFNMIKKSVILKVCILLASFMMFLYQFNFAINKLVDPLILETTDTLKVNKIEPPMMTVCEPGRSSCVQHFGRIMRRIYKGANIYHV